MVVVVKSEQKKKSRIQRLRVIRYRGSRQKTTRCKRGGLGDFNSRLYILSDKARRTVIDHWQKRKKEEINHPFFDQKIAIGLIPYAQAQLLARVIRGDLDEYPAFYWR